MFRSLEPIDGKRSFGDAKSKALRRLAVPRFRNSIIFMCARAGVGARVCVAKITEE